MSDPNRILTDEERRLAEAVAVAEQIELMLKIVLGDADMLAAKAGDVALLHVMSEHFSDCMEVATDAAALSVKIADMLADVRPQIEAIQANEALLRRECSGAACH